MSGFEPMFMAAAPEIGTATLATEVMGPTLIEGVGATLGPASLELGGLGGLLGGGVNAAGTGLGAGSLAGGLGSISTVAPEAAAQITAAQEAAKIGANQIISPEIRALQQQLANTAMPEITNLGEVATNELTPEMLANQAAKISSSYYPQVNQIPGYVANSAIEPTVLNTVAQAYPSGVMGGAPEASGLDKLFNMVKGAASKFSDLKPEEKMLYGGAGLLGANALLGKKQGVPAAEKYSGPLSKFHYNPSAYTPYTPQPPANPYRPVYTSYAGGGLADLGGYSDGGRMLKGPGDGMSDDIPATIAHKQPARLANEEFVVPADVVSHLGNGSSEAGAKQLYKMMDRVRQARTGNKKQGKQINPEKYLA